MHNINVKAYIFLWQLRTALTQSIAVIIMIWSTNTIINVVTHLQQHPGDEKQGQEKTHEHHPVCVLLAQEKYQFCTAN